MHWINKNTVLFIIVCSYCLYFQSSGVPWPSSSAGFTCIYILCNINWRTKADAITLCRCLTWYIFLINGFLTWQCIVACSSTPSHKMQLGWYAQEQNVVFTALYFQLVLHTIIDIIEIKNITFWSKLTNTHFVNFDNITSLKLMFKCFVLRPISKGSWG